MTRPEDSFERRFALEMAVKAMTTGTANISNLRWLREHTIQTANEYLKFLKGE